MQEVQRLSKITGLSETRISSIWYDAISKKLVIAYSNSNIDILRAKARHTIPDTKQRTIAGDNRIYYIYLQGNICYLSTGIGIIVPDIAKYG